MYLPYILTCGSYLDKVLLLDSFDSLLGVNNGRFHLLQICHNLLLLLGDFDLLLLQQFLDLLGLGLSAFRPPVDR